MEEGVGVGWWWWWGRDGRGGGGEGEPLRTFPGASCHLQSSLPFENKCSLAEERRSGKLQKFRFYICGLKSVGCCGVVRTV